MEGRSHLGVVIARSRYLALEILASLSHTAVEDAMDISISQRVHHAVEKSHGQGEGPMIRGTVKDAEVGNEEHKRPPPALERRPSMTKEERGRKLDCSAGAVDTELAVLALESVRLIKLFYWTLVEHLRSTDGTENWAAAAEMVDRFATQMESAELMHEYGTVQPNNERNHVKVPGVLIGGNEDDPSRAATMTNATSFSSPTEKAWYKKGGHTEKERKHDPTRAKPLLVLMWLRINIERMVKVRAMEERIVITEHLSALVAAYGGAHKIDATVLPLPYCQLLKVFEIFFVFTLPFVLAHQIGRWTPVVALFTAIGFFGLDQVGCELEGPFGVDQNDFPILSMGLSLCNDLDAMVRTVKRSRVEARVTSFSRDEVESIRKGADAALGWAQTPFV